MRVLYIDIDTLRPDHLGCYGYHRNTSPNIDKIAEQGVRFDHCHASDVPCLPSRTALCTGQFGIHNGVINHGGVAADLFIEGPDRGFRTILDSTSWAGCMKRLGLKTVTISTFAERHSAWQWYAGFSEAHNIGKGGLERADEVSPIAIDWIKRNGKQDNWFLHVHVWDPHGPFRAPAEFGEPFKDDPAPAWLTEDIRREHWKGCGPHSAQEVRGFEVATNFQPRDIETADSMAKVRHMFDGYDTGTLYADMHIGRILNALADEGVLDDTVIIVSSDHGENLGELNIYGDHQTADEITTRVPMIVRWPGVTDGKPRVDSALHYQIDFAATMIELLGGKTPENWDGVSFADAFRKGEEEGRERLIVSQGAWSCQRSVRFDDYICIRSYHDGYHLFPDIMLFDVKNDPHELHNLAEDRPDLVGKAMTMLEGWHGDMMRTAAHPIDPMQTVLLEGGPHHTLRHLPKYLERLRETGRVDCAEKLAAKHPKEA
ncbi:MAG: sulfatase [Armatimonadota bacterium]|nr:sulfatase [Armatimonadota bacterium]